MKLKRELGLFSVFAIAGVRPYTFRYMAQFKRQALAEMERELREGNQQAEPKRAERRPNRVALRNGPVDDRAANYGFRPAKSLRQEALQGGKSPR